MRTLVTGGAGFIGSHLVDRLLADGHEVTVVDDLSSGRLTNLGTALSAESGARLERLDIARDELDGVFAAAAPEVVFHLAAQSSVAISVERPDHDALCNVVGGVRVLETARRAGVRKVVYAASGGTLYGDVPEDRLPADESLPRRPESPYGVSKAAVLDYLRYYAADSGPGYAALALANVYGPRQDPFGEAGVVAIFAERAARGEALRIFGDGAQTRDFVFVDDVVDAFVRAAALPGDLVCNIGTGVETSVNRIAELVVEAAGPAQILREPARPGEVRRSALDAGLANRILGWVPTTTLAAGIRAVVEDVRSASRLAA